MSSNKMPTEIPLVYEIVQVCRMCQKQWITTVSFFPKLNKSKFDPIRIYLVIHLLRTNNINNTVKDAQMKELAK